MLSTWWNEFTSPAITGLTLLFFLSFAILLFLQCIIVRCLENKPGQGAEYSRRIQSLVVYLAWILFGHWAIQTVLEGGKELVHRMQWPEIFGYILEGLSVIAFFVAAFVVFLTWKLNDELPERE